MESMEDLYKTIGSKIKIKRVECGLTQADLGKKLGLTFQQVQKYEMAKNKVGIDKLYKISNILNTDIYYFLDENASSKIADELETIKEQDKIIIIKMIKNFIKLNDKLKMKIIDLVKELSVLTTRQSSCTNR